MSRLKTTALLGLMTACACSAEAQPEFEEIKEAVETHARCLDEAVKRLDTTIGTREQQVQQVRDQCAQERAEALRLKAVPVFEATVEEYDAMQDDLADVLITSKMSEKAE